jgi:hypothetical protein
MQALHCELRRTRLLTMKPHPNQKRRAGRAFDGIDAETGYAVRFENEPAGLVVFLRDLIPGVQPCSQLADGETTHT